MMNDPMAYSYEGWPFQPDKCNCDVEFLEWLQLEDARAAHQISVFHMGPGLHHLVGQSASPVRRVLALTDSPEEMHDYMRRIIQHPKWAQSYVVMWGDIYTIPSYLYPDVDIASLFHLGEMPDERREAYRRYDDGDVIDNMWYGRLLQSSSPALLFYTGSSAWDRIEPLVMSRFGPGVPQIRQTKIETYKQLLVVRRHG